MTTPGAALPMLTIVIPAYNEAANVPVVVSETVEQLNASALAGRWHIVLVDDGSTDRTGQVVDQLARDIPGVEAVHHPLNRGFGAALKTGYSAARGEYVTLITGDGEVGVAQALRLLEAMNGADLIISSRVRPADASRTILSAVFGCLTRCVTGLDAAKMSGIYVIRRDLLQSMPLRSDTGVLNFEIVLRASRLGKRIESGVTEIRPRLSGASKVTNVRTTARVALELVKLRVGLALERSA